MKTNLDFKFRGSESIGELTIPEAALTCLYALNTHLVHREAKMKSKVKPRRYASKLMRRNLAKYGAQ